MAGLNDWVDNPEAVDPITGEKPYVDRSPEHVVEGGAPIFPSDNTGKMYMGAMVGSEEEEAKVEELFTQADTLKGIQDDILETGGVCQDYVVEARHILPEFDGNKPIAFYTKFPSATRCREALESLEAGIIATLAAIAAAVLAAIYAIYKLFTGKGDSDETDASQAVKRDVQIIKESKPIAKEVEKSVEEMERSFHRGVEIREEAAKDASSAARPVHDIEELKRRLNDRTMENFVNIVESRPPIDLFSLAVLTGDRKIAWVLTDIHSLVVSGGLAKDIQERAKSAARIASNIRNLTKADQEALMETFQKGLGERRYTIRGGSFTSQDLKEEIHSIRMKYLESVKYDRDTTMTGLGRVLVSLGNNVDYDKSEGIASACFAALCEVEGVTRRVQKILDGIDMSKLTNEMYYGGMLKEVLRALRDDAALIRVCLGFVASFSRAFRSEVDITTYLIIRQSIMLRSAVNADDDTKSKIDDVITAAKRLAKHCGDIMKSRV